MQNCSQFAMQRPVQRFKIFKQTSDVNRLIEDNKKRTTVEYECRHCFGWTHSEKLNEIGMSNNDINENKGTWLKMRRLAEISAPRLF